MIDRICCDKNLNNVKKIQNDINEEIKSSCKKDNKNSLLSACNGCAHRKKMKIVIIEAILTLEESRKSFKSKRLAELRKTLLKALEEDT